MSDAGKMNCRMVLVDLDGTLLNNEKQIGLSDYQTLNDLGKLNIIRVFATGRNLHSALKVLPSNTPFDYLIFSSGAGIINWKTGEMLFQSSIGKNDVLKVEHTLKILKLNFSIHLPIPENHKYYYFKGNNLPTDFDVRNSIYDGFNFELINGFPFDFATQFLVILPDESDFEFVGSHVEGLKIIRATSPIDGKSVWLEIFNNDVSKAKGGIFLCNKLNISQSDTIGIGNDYNDIDLLDWTAKSFIVENAPEILRHKYKWCTNNSNNPLSYVVNEILN